MIRSTINQDSFDKTPNQVLKLMILEVIKDNNNLRAELAKTQKMLSDREILIVEKCCKYGYCTDCRKFIKLFDDDTSYVCYQCWSHFCKDCIKPEDTQYINCMKCREKLNG